MVVYEGLGAGQLTALELANEGIPPAAFREVRRFLDLSVVARVRGRKNQQDADHQLQRFFKRWVLGDREARLTVRLTDAFFADDDNFGAFRGKSIGTMTLRSNAAGPWTVPEE